MSDAINIEMERISTAWERLESVVAPLTIEPLTRLTRDRWSIKDHLVHIMLAEQFCIAALRDEPVFLAIGVDKETYMRSTEDELNEIGYQFSLTLSPNDALARWQAVHRQLLDCVTGLKDQDLLERFAPSGLEPTAMSMLDILRGNTYEHYDLHRGWIEATLKGGDQGRN